MKCKIIIVFALAGLMMYSYSCKTGKGAVAQSAATTIYSKEGYRLVWADEFNKDGAPDIQNWRFEKGFVRNDEKQWYQSENAFIKKGKLIIEGRKERKPNPAYVADTRDWRKQNPTIEYTSASINTEGMHSWKYGRFIMRGRIDISKGLWPAWWTMGILGKWPAKGEIDIMEYYRNRLLANIACLGRDNKAEWYSNTKSTDSLGGKKWASKFHVWRMDWDENEIALYVDDMLMNKMELSKLINKDGTNTNPFKQPHYLLLNLAMGGMNGGDITATTKFPTKLEVDYIRVYQKQ